MYKIVAKMASSASVPSDVYPHIYSFLLQNNLLKTAKAFKAETLVVSLFSAEWIVSLNVPQILKSCTRACIERKFCVVTDMLLYF